MKYVCLYSFFLIPLVTIAHPLVDHGFETPVEARKAAASPGPLRLGKTDFFYYSGLKLRKDAGTLCRRSQMASFQAARS